MDECRSYGLASEPASFACDRSMPARPSSTTLAVPESHYGPPLRGRNRVHESTSAKSSRSIARPYVRACRSCAACRCAGHDASRSANRLSGCRPARRDHGDRRSRWPQRDVWRDAASARDAAPATTGAALRDASVAAQRRDVERLARRCRGQLAPHRECRSARCLGGSTWRRTRECAALRLPVEACARRAARDNTAIAVRRPSNRSDIQRAFVARAVRATPPNGDPDAEHRYHRTWGRRARVCAARRRAGRDPDRTRRDDQLAAHSRAAGGLRHHPSGGGRTRSAPAAGASSKC